MHNVCNVCMPQAICDVISNIGIGIGAAAADSLDIGCQHSIGLTLQITRLKLQNTRCHLVHR